MGARAGVCLRGDDDFWDDDERSPVTQKNCSDGVRGLIAWSSAEMQGWRETMEDAHLTLASLREAVLSETPIATVDSGWANVGLFGVFDGHGGFQVAKFCERHLPAAIAARPSANIANAMAEAFVEMDQLMKEPKGLQELKRLSSLAKSLRIKRQSAEGMGTTAVLCCVTPSTLVVANCGDSRAVLCRAGAAIELSQDHKPSMPEERARILEAGGWIQNGAVPRVNGDLSLSRALGDLEYKDETLPPESHIVTAVPELRSVARSGLDEFLLLACDGVWDVVSSQSAVDFVRQQLGDRQLWQRRIATGTLRPSDILQQLLDHCLSPDLAITAGLGGDNMTVVLVLFLPVTAFQYQGATPTTPTRVSKILHWYSEPLPKQHRLLEAN